MCATRSRSFSSVDCNSCIVHSCLCFLVGTGQFRRPTPRARCPWGLPEISTADTGFSPNEPIFDNLLVVLKGESGQRVGRKKSGFFDLVAWRRFAADDLTAVDDEDDWSVGARINPDKSGQANLVAGFFAYLAHRRRCGRLTKVYVTRREAPTTFTWIDRPSVQEQLSVMRDEHSHRDLWTSVVDKATGGTGRPIVAVEKAADERSRAVGAKFHTFSPLNAQSSRTVISIVRVHADSVKFGECR